MDLDKAMAVCNKLGYNTNKMKLIYSPSALVALSVWFLCREIEISGTLACELQINILHMMIHFTLPASKTDTEAKGVVRSLGCLCNITNRCPAHIARKYLIDLKRHFVGRMGKDWRTLPLFPRTDGTAMSKEAVVSLVQAITKAHGGRTHDEVGRPLLSGHVFRITGARLLPKLGLDVITISLHGRWSSASVMLYIADSPLESLTARLGAGVLIRKELQVLKNKVSELELSRLHAAESDSSSSSDEG